MIEGIVITFILILMITLGVCAFEWGSDFWHLDNPLIGIFLIFIAIPMLVVVGICIHTLYSLFFGGPV